MNTLSSFLRIVMVSIALAFALVVPAKAEVKVGLSDWPGWVAWYIAEEKGMYEKHGAAIEVEDWELDNCEYGSFVTSIPAPLGIGTIELADGSAVQGFVYESRAVTSATDTTAFGAWRAFLAAKGTQANNLGPASRTI